ncbi:MAG: glycosyltransferase family 1 protein [Oscillospiraceae bacterium]|nr:glycosyltransferase family 1 protein [Oscillospiraceae bacterium]
MQHLNELADLGLTVRGSYWDQEYARYFPEVALSANREQMFSLEENEKFYNSLKIGFNCSHIQAVSGFSWRVCDIMASNACLVTEEKATLREMFPNIDLPMYNTRFEAREICKKLLDNPSMREDIVAACNEAIDKNYRFCHVREAMEQFTGIKLTEEKEGSLRFVMLRPEAAPAAKAAASAPPDVLKKLSIPVRAIRKVYNKVGSFLKKKGAI